jgi:hypothetical protein
VVDFGREGESWSFEGVFVREDEGDFESAALSMAILVVSVLLHS